MQEEEMMMTRCVLIYVVDSSDQYEWHDDSSSSLHVFRFSVEERHRLIAPSWFTSKHIEDYDDGEDDDIVQEVLQQSVHEEFGFSNDDFISRAYEKSVSDFISNVEFLSNDGIKYIEDTLFRWVEMNDVFNLKVADVKIVVLIREETNGEVFSGEEFDGEFKSVIDIQDDDEAEVALAPAPAPQVEVDQEVIQIEDDDEEEVEVLVVEEDDSDEARELMETVFGSNDYMEVEEPNYDVDDLGGGGGIDQQRWEEYIEEENNYFGFSNRMDDGEEERWERYVEEEDNYWFGFSNRNGVSRDMIEASMRTSDYDPKKDGDCMICMDGFSSKLEEIAAEMPCSHEFHKSCIVEWLQLKNSCPLCRFEICNKDDPH